MRRRLRSHLTYANVISTVCLFLLLGGGSALALRGSNTVFSDDIVNGEVKTADLATGAATRRKLAGSAVNSAKVADNSLTGADITNDSLTGADIGPSAVGPGEIQNINRVIQLPLTSFVNFNDLTVLDTVPSDGTSPDLRIPGNHLEIEWDDDTDGGGPNLADKDLVATGFAVPPDYASSGHFLVVVSKDADSGVEERFFCQVVLNAFNGGGQDSASASATNLVVGRAWYFVVPPVIYAPGDSVSVWCRADDGVGGTSADDVVRLEQIQFRYIASQ